MRKGGGRSKGSAFERRVAKMVVEAFACFGITNKDCYRTPLSGGHVYAKQEDPGDLVISAKLRKLFPFHVEAKAYRQVNVDALFIPIDKQPDGLKFHKWVKQVLKASAKDTGLTPVIVFKRNNGPVLALLPADWLGFTRPPVLQTTYKNKPWQLVKFDRLLRQCAKRQEKV